jgi:hypothetical protein
LYVVLLGNKYLFKTESVRKLVSKMNLRYHMILWSLFLSSHKTNDQNLKDSEFKTEEGVSVGYNFTSRVGLGEGEKRVKNPPHQTLETYRM